MFKAVLQGRWRRWQLFRGWWLLRTGHRLKKEPGDRERERQRERMRGAICVWTTIQRTSRNKILHCYVHCSIFAELMTGKYVRPRDEHDCNWCKIMQHSSAMFKCYINQLGMDWLNMCGVFGTKWSPCGAGSSQSPGRWGGDSILELVRMAKTLGIGSSCCSLHGKGAQHTGHQS